MTIIISSILILAVIWLVIKFYPKNLSQQNQKSGFNPKPIPESTHVIPSSPEILTQKIEKSEDIFPEQPPKKRKYNKKKGPKKMEAKKAH